MATGEVGRQQITKKLANKTLSNASIIFKCDGHTYSCLFHGSNFPPIFPSRNKLKYSEFCNRAAHENIYSQLFWSKVSRGHKRPSESQSSCFWHNIFQMRWLEFAAYEYTFADYPSLSRLSPCGIYDRVMGQHSRAIFKFLAVGIMTDRLKHVGNDFKSVYFFTERKGGKFYKLEPWNKREYVWPPRLKTIDAFHVLLARFVAISSRPTSPDVIASNLCVLHNTIFTKWCSLEVTR